MRRARSFWPPGRVRRPADVTWLLATVGAIVALGLLSQLLPARAEVGVPDDVWGLPQLLLSVANAVASLAVLAVLVAIAADAVRRRRYALPAALLASGLGVLLAVAADEAADAGWTVALGPAKDSAVVPLAAGVAFLVAADLPHGRRLLALGHAALVAAACCALALDSLTVPGVVAAALTGTAAGLGVRVAAGVVPARPPEDLVRSVLARAGVPVDGLHPLQQEAGRARYTSKDDFGEVLVTVVDPDRRGVTLARRAWRVLRFRTLAVGHPALSLRGVLERQALVSALAASAGVTVPAVVALVAAGPGLVLVERPLAGTRLDEVPDGGPEVLLPGFRTLRRLHDAGLAHGALTAQAVLLLPGGDAGLTDLALAQPAASELQRDLDVVALLVAGATRVGVDAAVTALRTAYVPDPAAEARLTPLVQPLGLARPLRRAVSGTTVLDDLRNALVAPARRGSSAAPRLERFRPRTVLSVIGGTVAVYVLAGQLSDVELGSALASAGLGWFAVALVGSAVTYLGAALVLNAFAPTRLPLGRSTLVQVAASFVTLVTPPTVGHLGLNVRYLQRAGVPVAVAAATVGVGQVVTVVVTVVLLLACGWLSGVSPTRPSLLPSGEVIAVLLVAALLLALAAALPATRRALRRRVEPLVRRTLPQLLEAVSDPRRLATAVVGVLLLNGGNVLALDASLRAFSTSLAFPALVVVYLVGSTVGSAAPTPGGLGAVEASLVAGLTATGLPVATAITGVLAFRAATFWLPAPVGWVTFVGLQRRRVI